MSSKSDLNLIPRNLWVAGRDFEPYQALTTFRLPEGEEILEADRFPKPGTEGRWRWLKATFHGRTSCYAKRSGWGWFSTERLIAYEEDRVVRGYIMLKDHFLPEESNIKPQDGIGFGETKEEACEMMLIAHINAANTKDRGLDSAAVAVLDELDNGGEGDFAKAAKRLGRADLFSRIIDIAKVEVRHAEKNLLEEKWRLRWALDAANESRTTEIKVSKPQPREDDDVDIERLSDTVHALADIVTEIGERLERLEKKL